MKDRLGAAWFGPVRVVLLALVALAALADVTTYVALVAGDDRPRSPGDVARVVVQAVADDDCDDLDTLLDEAALPASVTSCLAGVPSPVALTDVTVLNTAVDGGTAQVGIALAADGEPAEVLVVLRRVSDRWIVTDVRPVSR